MDADRQLDTDGDKSEVKSAPNLKHNLTLDKQGKVITVVNGATCVLGEEVCCNSKKCHLKDTTITLDNEVHTVSLKKDDVSTDKNVLTASLDASVTLTEKERGIIGNGAKVTDLDSESKSSACRSPNIPKRKYEHEKGFLLKDREIDEASSELDNEGSNKSFKIGSIATDEKLHGNIESGTVPSIHVSKSKSGEDASTESENTQTRDCEDIVKIGCLVDLLNETNKDWMPYVKKISCLVRKHHDTDIQHKLVAVLIDKNFVGKLEDYVHMNEVATFQSLKDVERSKANTMWSVIKTILVIFWIISDQDVNFCQYLLTVNSFDFLLSELRAASMDVASYADQEMMVFVVKAILGIFHNISRHVPNCKYSLRNKGAVPVIRMFLASKIPMIRVKSLMVLSYILSEAENDIIASDDDNFMFIHSVLTDALRSKQRKSVKFGMTVGEVLHGLNNLAINEENKIRMVKNGFLDLYEEVLQDGSAEEKKQTLLTLWSLAFHHFNKQKMKSMTGIMRTVFELQQCDNRELCQAARGMYWELEHSSNTAIGTSLSYSLSSGDEGSQPHVMISYQWDCQPLLISVKDKLRLAGYKVWMDVEHMTGSTLEAMALAVERAAVVLVCMSQKYKNSPNCRTEAEYVYRLRKDFIPLRLQEEYVPDGWLGIMVGTRLYFDVHTQEMVDIQLHRIVRELGHRGKLYTSQDSGDSCDGTHAPPVPQRMTSREAVPLLSQGLGRGSGVKHWTPEQVHHWLLSTGVPEEELEHLTGLDGPLLKELQVIQTSAPESFFSLLQRDFKLQALSVLKVSRALRTLH